VLPAPALEALDEYLTIRAALTGADVDALTGPMFATTSTTGDPGHSALLVRPDLHVVWRGTEPVTDPDALAALATGWVAPDHAAT
jgi:hypothetical protein